MFIFIRESKHTYNTNNTFFQNIFEIVFFYTGWIYSSKICKLSVLLLYVVWSYFCIYTNRLLSIFCSFLKFLINKSFHYISNFIKNETRGTATIFVVDVFHKTSWFFREHRVIPFVDKKIENPQTCPEISTKTIK